MKVDDLIVVHDDEPVGMIIEKKRKDRKWVYTYRYLSDGKVLTATDHLLNAQLLRSKIAWNLQKLYYNRIEKEGDK